MHYTRTILIFILCITLQPTSAMQKSSDRQSIPISLQKIFGDSRCWQALPHTKLALLNEEEPITDELLWSINPKWKPIEAFTYREKNSLLREAVSLKDHAINPLNLYYAVCKTLIALIISAGANPNKTEGLSGYRYNSLWHAVSSQDIHFTEYLLKKGANPNQQYPGELSHCLFRCKKTQLAQLLINYGAKIPEGILERCCRISPASLLQLYIDNGGRAIPSLDSYYSYGYHALQIIASNEPLPVDKKDRLEKAKILLTTTIDIAYQGKDGNTVLHLDAGPRSKTPIDIAYQVQSLDFTLLIINHYLQQQKGFLHFLAFLRRDHPAFYQQTKDLRKRYFLESASHMKELRHLLGIKNNKGETAYDLWPIEELNPHTCTYEKYALLLKKAQ